MKGLFQDVRFATRQLRKSPGLAIVAILTLALGIGASAVIFSVVYNGVLYPFPYRSADRLTAINLEDVGGEAGTAMYPLSDVAALRQGNHTFEDILAYGLWYVVYTHEDTKEMVKGVGASPNAMEFWGVPPLLGRGFGEQDVRPGGPLVALLNYRFWNKEFHGDKNILGAMMMLNGKARTIIGVMPPRFQAVGADLYMPVSWTRSEPVRGRFEFDVDDPLFFWSTGILKRGVSLQTAAADVDPIFRRLAPLHPDIYPKQFRVSTKWLNDLILANFKQTLLLLFAAVGLLLFIACSNVAGLLLAHASARTKEIALRAALGAGRGRLIRQLLSESLVLAVAGCGAGCLIAYLGMKAFMRLPLNDLLPTEAVISLNLPVLFFAVGTSLVATILCGTAPAFHAVRSDLQKGLAGTGVNVNASFQHGRFRSGLVIGQVALSLLLLTCAGLIARSFIALTRVDLGIRPQDIFYAEVHFPKNRYTKSEEKVAFFSRFMPELKAIPGVVNATELIGLPLFFAPRGDVTIPGKPHGDRWMTNVELCSEGYFQTLGLHLLHGRLLSESDVLSARRVAVVNETLARKYFAGEDPLGRQIKFNVLDEIPETPRDVYFEIVGVVNDSRDLDMEGMRGTFADPAKTTPKAFLPYSFSGFGDRSIAIQSRVQVASLVNSVRQVVRSLDQDVVLVPSELTGTFSFADAMGTLVYDKPKFAAVGFSACALLGFVLAVVGLFSVMTYIAALKTHDVGIRLALGAPHATIVRMMLKRGLTLTATGVLIGIPISLGLARLLSSQFRGISASDPLTLILVITGVMIAGLSACYLPARRAAVVDPMRTLRNE